MSLLFNQTYLNERLLPNYTYFKIHDLAAHHDTETQMYYYSIVKNILCHYLFRDKIIQNCLKIDATHLYDNDLL